jgi:Tfp pilus assembly protein PilF
MRPSHFNARQYLGVLYLMTGRPIDAREHLESAVRLNPESIEANTALGITYMKNNMPEEAKMIEDWLEERNPAAAEKMRKLGGKK